MMELSTIMPNTTIKAASVTVFSGMPQAYMTPIEIKTLIGMEVAATNAERNGEQYHHHQDHDHDGHEQIPHEGTYRVSHHLRLVGDPADRDTLRKIRSKARSTSSTSFPYRTILWPSTHLHGKDDRFLAVVRYIAIRLGIFPYDTGHVFQADHMPVGIG